jgi:alpha-1,2-mannosyltransferase
MRGSRTVTLLVRGSLIAIAVVGVAVALWTFPFEPARFNGDAWNYLAAGERLNAGHPLYELGPTDRQVLIVPPYWTVPLLAPPPIAVAWRPLALLGEPSMWLWGLACLVAVVAVAAVVATRRSDLALGVLAVCALPVALTALSGNVNALLLPAVVAAWIWRDHPWRAGSLLAVVAAIKLTPILILLWPAMSGRLRIVLTTAAVLAGIGLVSLAGAGLDAHLAWLASVPGSVPSPLALASITGLPPLVVAAILGVGVVAVSRLGDERLTFAAAVVAAALASPAMYFQSLALLVAAVAPWAFPPVGKPATEVGLVTDSPASQQPAL